MTQTEDLGQFSFSMDGIFDGIFDAVDDTEDGLFLPNKEGRTEFLPPDPDRIPVIENTIKQDSEEYAARPAEDRTRELFGQMRSQRNILRAMLDMARTPCTTAQLDERAEEARQASFSIYTTSNIAAMLETTGALKRVTADGSDYTEVAVEPDVVVEDGVAFYQPTETPAIYWQITEAGLRVLDDDSALGRIEALFEKEEAFRPIYKRILTLAAADDGVSISTLSDNVDDDPVIAEPRRFFVQHFTDLLENRDAIAWDGSAWKTTDIGKQALELLSGVEDNFVPGTPDDKRVATETDGINW